MFPRSEFPFKREQHSPNFEDLTNVKSRHNSNHTQNQKITDSLNENSNFLMITINIP